MRNYFKTRRLKISNLKIKNYSKIPNDFKIKNNLKINLFKKGNILK